MKTFTDDKFMGSIPAFHHDNDVLFVESLVHWNDGVDRRSNEVLANGNLSDHVCPLRLMQFFQLIVKFLQKTATFSMQLIFGT